MAGVLRREQYLTASAFSFTELERQGQQIIARAQEQAARLSAEIEAKARERAAQLEAEARPRGLERGRREGLQQALAEAREQTLAQSRSDMERLTGALQNALSQFEQNKHHLLAQAEVGLIELSLAIARRVCKQLATKSSEVALANSRAVVQMIQHAGDAKLHMNPADLALLQDAAPEFSKQHAALEHVELAGDENVPRGGCVLETNGGLIDATLETQLDRIAEALLSHDG